MKAPSLQELRQELQALPAKELAAICQRLARFKMENKQFLSYLLFEEKDQEAFRRSISEEIEAVLSTMNKTHLYFAKKTVRKAQRLLNKYIRFSGIPETELALRIDFCEQLLETGIPIRESPVISNVFTGQLKKIRAIATRLHEDVVYDYAKRMDTLDQAFG